MRNRYIGVEDILQTGHYNNYRHTCALSLKDHALNKDEALEQYFFIQTVILPDASVGV
jgi:hypothetical protein